MQTLREVNKQKQNKRVNASSKARTLLEVKDLTEKVVLGAPALVNPSLRRLVPQCPRSSERGAVLLALAVPWGLRLDSYRSPGPFLLL